MRIVPFAADMSDDEIRASCAVSHPGWTVRMVDRGATQLNLSEDFPQNIAAALLVQDAIEENP